MPDGEKLDLSRNQNEIRNLETQVNTQYAKIGKTTPTQAQTQIDASSWWSATNAMTISAVTLGFGLAVIVIGAVLIRKGSDIEGVTRFISTVVILVGAFFLVVAGYSSTQIAPVIGLLGTIAGYLLGKARQEIAKPAE